MTVSETLFVARTFASPPQRVFEALTTPALCALWMGPRGSETTVLELDAREGGRLLLEIRFGPDTAVRIGGEFRRIEAPRLVEFTWSMEGDDHDTVVSIELQPAGADTSLVLAHEGLTIEERAQNEAGWGEFFDRLAEALASTA